MDFQQLLAKMNELDQPAPAAAAVVEEPVATDECGEMPPSPMGMSMPKEQDAPPPSMSINLNAQGLDNIEELMNLIKAVNKDMDQPAPSMAPSIEIEPMDKPGAMSPMKLGNLDSGPLKMLPDLDSDEGGEEPEIDIMNKPGGDDEVSKAQGDLDNDGDHDMDDHDMEKKDKEEEAFGNSVGDSEPEVGEPKDAIPDGNDLNKPKTMHKHSYRQGDNPMAMEGEELRSWIRSELQKKLAEAKGAK